MCSQIGIRLEDKNEWESRTPLVPSDVKELVEKHNIKVLVQSSAIRAFTGKEYRNVGADTVDHLSESSVIFAIKEIPTEILESGKTYIYFTHTIKGQKDNMPMLQRILDLGCQLIDYEKIVNDQQGRLVFFGNYAGMAGMIDTLWALGRRLRSEGLDTPFGQIQQAHRYANLDQATAEIRNVGRAIKEQGLPLSIAPLVVGFAGYGNVSRGAQQILNLLPVQHVSPADLAGFHGADPCRVYSVEFKEEDMVKPKATGAAFKLQEYYDHPDGYRSVFESYLPHLTVLVNGIYWTDRYPRLVTRRFLKTLFREGEKPRLRVIGDISCDVNGAVECNVRTTSPGNPVYVFDPMTEQAQDGYEGQGVVVLAVDNLPCELPRESSSHFSETLLPFVPEIAQADYGKSLDESGLSDTIKRAVIAWQGNLTPDYQYLEQYL